MKKKIIILGATGFIGKNTLELFKNLKQFEVYGTYFKKIPRKDSNIKYLKADLTCKSDVSKCLKDKDYVVQAAAVTGGLKDARKNAIKYISDNAVINSNVLDCSIKYKIKHFIFLSCTLMYKSSFKPQREKDLNLNEKMHPGYFGGAWNKIYIEKICEYYSNISNTKFTVLRHSNVYGPNDKYDLDKSHLFAATIKKVLDTKENSKIKIWGDGNQKRDIIYIDDLTNAIKLAIKNQKNKFEIFNIGSGKMIKVKDLVKKIISKSKKKLLIEYDLSKPSNTFFVSLDCKLAFKKIKWKNKTNIEKGIVKTIEWYNKYYRK